MSYAGFNVLNGVEYINKVIDELDTCNRGTKFLSHPNMMRPEISNLMRSSIATHTFWDNVDIVEGLYTEAENAWANVLEYDTDDFRTVLNWDSITEVLTRFMEVYGAKISIFTTDKHYVPSNLLRIYDESADVRWLTVTDETTEEVINEKVAEAIRESDIILLRGLNYSKWTFNDIAKKLYDTRAEYREEGKLCYEPIIIADATTNVPFYITNDDLSFGPDEDMFPDVYCFNCGGIMGGPDSYVVLIDENSESILQDNQTMYDDLLKYITTDNFDRCNLATIAGKLLTAEYCDSREFKDNVEKILIVRDDIEAQFASWKHSDMIVKCSRYTTDIVIDVSKIAEPFTDDDDYKITSGELAINLSLYHDYAICSIGTPEDIQNDRDCKNDSGLLLNIPSLIGESYIYILQTLIEECVNEYEALHDQWIEECCSEPNDTKSTNLFVEMATSFGEAVKEAGRTLISAFKPKGDDDNAKRG